MAKNQDDETIYYVLLGLLILSACTNDEYLAQRTEVEEGIPTVVKLSVTIPMSGKIETKAFSDSGVADLYVVFL